MFRLLIFVKIQTLSLYFLRKLLCIFARWYEKADINYNSALL